MSTSNPVLNHYESVLEAARRAHQAKAQAAAEAQYLYQNSLEVEMPALIREEEVHRRLMNR